MPQPNKGREHLQIIEYANPTESRIEYTKRFGNLPGIEKPLGWDGNNFQDVFKTKDLPFLTTEEFDWNGKAIGARNRLVWGDNLAVMRTLPDKSIDLIYIDPPFFSGRNYNLIFGDEAEVRSFRDIWDGGMPTYLTWLNARLWEMKRLLKDTGSIYVHCDWHASHYIKCEMDKIFGYENFINEVAWGYRTQGATKKRWSRKHDVLLFYAKTENWTFNFMTERSYMKHKYGFGKDDFKLDEDGRQYRDALVRDIWEIPALQSATKEQIGYPTQKPEALIERVIKASSNEGDVVADFFTGGGTTLSVAEKLNRRWLGCDISRIAISVTRDRLLSTYSKGVGIKPILEIGKTGFNVENHGSYDKAIVRVLEPDQYLTFIMQCYEAVFKPKGRLIHGFKGERAVHVAPQNQRPTIESIEEFHVELMKQKISSGVIVAWEWDRECEKFIEELRNGKLGPDIQLVQVKLLKIESDEFKGDNIQFLNKPTALITCSNKKGMWVFDGSRSQGRNSTDIHHYQWDFNYKGRFSPMTQPKFPNEQDKSENPPNDNRRVEYQFPHNGKFKVALRIFDKSGAEAIDVKEVDVVDVMQRAA